MRQELAQINYLIFPVPFGFRTDSMPWRKSPTAHLWKAENQPMKLAKSYTCSSVIWTLIVC